ncbi:hypothetical protein PF004_g30459 [Phytophthora fragariae]|uniref:Mnd1 HTH domain-containing protein n=1 Tax=Phytophthora fragariae TaxID=53985 RepID=A0A6G0MCX2_9STRA|nr:hypothetical protein PF004_g30459 [Phytophthora fragariae]
MGRKGVSLQEKRERILRIYHESKDVLNLRSWRSSTPKLASWNPDIKLDPPQ